MIRKFNRQQGEGGGNNITTGEKSTAKRVVSKEKNKENTKKQLSPNQQTSLFDNQHEPDGNDFKPVDITHPEVEIEGIDC